MKTETKNQFLYPKEPSRFEPKHIDDLLIYCHHIDASDITIQTGEAIIAEIYGRLHKITRRHLSDRKSVV